MCCCSDPGSQLLFTHLVFHSCRLKHPAAVQVTPIPSLPLPFTCSVRQRWPPLLALLLVSFKSSRKSPNFPMKVQRTIFAEYITLTIHNIDSLWPCLQTGFSSPCKISSAFLPLHKLHLNTLTYELFGTNGHIILQKLIKWTIIRL